MQRDRRHDPYPWTWELPAGVALVLLLGLLVGAQLGRGVANLVAGAGWTWPDGHTSLGASSPFGAEFWRSIPGVLGGDAGAGLAAPVPTGIASPGLLWVTLGVVETAWMGALITLIVYCFHRWGPNRMRGMASRAEAEQLLGLTNLRKRAAVVRPDLYGKHAGSAPQMPIVPDPLEPPSSPSSELGRGLSPWLLPNRKENR